MQLHDYASRRDCFRKPSKERIMGWISWQNAKRGILYIYTKDMIMLKVGGFLLATRSECEIYVDKFRAVESDRFY